MAEVAPTSGEGPVLEARGLRRDFRGFVAVAGLDLDVRRGAIHALIGPNGAGKTTVFNLLTGVLRPSGGTIRFDGRDVTGRPPAEVSRLGMVRSFQISAVFPNLTVLENVRVALQRSTGNAAAFWRSDRALRALDGQAMALLEAVELGGSRDSLAAELPYGHKRALELATTLALEPTLLLLDEPTQGMGREDVGRVVALIRKAAAGRTVLMVEHNLSVVADLCQTITVLARGAVLAEGSYAEVSRDARVLEAYIGVPE
jgi:branched-chain amino acid transport system ATP-binding protein